MKTILRKSLVAVVPAVAAVLCAALITGCATPSPVHIKKDNYASAQSVDPKTADTHYAVLKYYVDVYEHMDKDEMAVAAAKVGLAKAETVVRLNWRKETARKFPFLILMQDKLTVSGAAGADAGELRAAMDWIDAGIAVKPRLKTAKGFYWVSGIGFSDEFAAWIKNTKLHLPAKSGANLKAYNRLKDALEADSQKTLAAVKKLVTAKKYGQAYEQLDAKASLYRDTAAAKRVQAARLQVAPLLLKAEIARYRQLGFATAKANKATKAALYAGRSKWLADDVLAQAFKQKAVQKDFQRLQSDIGTAQAELWKAEMKALAARNHHWKLFLFHQARLVEAGKLEKPVMTAASKGIWTRYLALLPQSYAHFLDTAEQEIQKGERHGNALILYGMIQEIGDFVAAAKQKLSAKAADQLKDAGRRRVRSQKFVKLFVARKLFIKEIKPKDGLGTELRNDLKASFSKQFRNSPMVYGMTLGEEDVKVSPKDYVMSEGIYATLEADYGLGRTVQEVVTLKGEVIATDNPEYLRLVRKKKDTEGVPPKLYEQAYYKYTIKRKITEAVANARLGFVIEYGDKKENHKINLKQSLRRTFIQESIDPEKTKRYTKQLASKPDDMGVKNPKPKLKVDRVMTLLEMKEWARNETAKIAMMRLLATLSSYPLELNARATAFAEEDNWQMAGNFMGICLGYCRNLDPAAAAKSEYFVSADPPAYLKDEYKRNSKLVKEITALKKKLWPRSVDAIVKYLETD